MNKRIFLFIYLVSFAFIARLNAQSLPINIDFEGFVDGQKLTESMLQDDMGLSVEFFQGSGKSVIDKSVSFSGESSLKVVYNKGEIGPDAGCQFPVIFNPEDEVYVSYNFMLGEDFLWGGTDDFGGKLPGLASTGLCGGNMYCDGTDGFSARFMWGREGDFRLYLYHMDKTIISGESHIYFTSGSDRFHLQRGVWYTLTERVKINTGNNKDGEVQCWLDGHEFANLTNIRFVNNGDKVDRFYFTTFYGGGQSCAPAHDCHIWFDNIKVSTTSSITSNSMPVANAGANKTVVLPNSVTFNGSGTDSDGTIEGYSWKKTLGADCVLSGENTENLTVSGLSTGVYVFSLTVRDNDGSTDTDDVAVIVFPESGNFSFAINSGGDSLTGDDGTAYVKDCFYYGGDKKAKQNDQIDGTQDQELYQHYRNGNFSYAIPIVNGEYTVTLKMMESYWTSAGERLFDVEMEGENIIENLDIVNKVGSKFVAYDETHTVTVTDGELNINFTASKDYGILCALVIERTGGITSANTISGVNPDRDVTVYPNPVKNYVIVDNIAGFRQIKLIDIQGKIVKTIYISSNQEKIDLNNIRSGMYTIQLIDENLPVVTKKIIVE